MKKISICFTWVPIGGSG